MHCIAMRVLQAMLWHSNQLLFAILAVPTVSYAQSISCHCVASNSTYLTTAQPLATTATSIRSSMSSIGSKSSVSSSTHVTSPAPTAAPGFILLNVTSSLTAALDPSHAFKRSKPSPEYDSATNFFSLSRGSSQVELVIDLLVGPTGTACRSMPHIDKICVSSNCSGCNLKKFSAAAAKSFDDPMTQRIVPDETIDNATFCAARDSFADFGDFRYIVLFPLDAPKDSSQPYAFGVGISGNFSLHFNSCPAARRKRSVQQPLDSSSSVIGPADDEAPADRFLSQLSRHRREVPSDCSCPVGLDPVFISSRTAHVSWEFPLKPFSIALSNISSAEHMALAIESYYLLMDAVRNLSVSNLTAVIGDLFDIEFSAVAAVSSRAPSLAAAASSDSTGTRLSASVSIRNDSFYYSDKFLLEQLKAILPGYGSNIVNLTVHSVTSTTTPLAPVASLPAYGIVLICIAGAAALVASIPLAMWLHRVIRAKSRSTEYGVRPPPDSSSVNGPPEGIANNGKDGEHRLGRTIDAAVDMPVTFFRRGGGSDWPPSKPFDDSVIASSSSPQGEPDDKQQLQQESAIYSYVEMDQN